MFFEYIDVRGRLQSDVSRIGRSNGVLRVGTDDDLGPGRVVTVFLARTSRRDREPALGDSRIEADFSQLFERNCSRAQHYRRSGSAINDRRFDANLALIPSQDAADAPVEVCSHRLPGGRTRSARDIGRRSDDRDTACAEELLCERVSRHPHAYRLQTSRSKRWDLIALRQDEGERPGKKPADQPLRDQRNHARDEFKLRDIRNMCDQRVVRWSPFRDENFPDCTFVEDMRAQPIDCLRRESDDFTVLNKACGNGG